MQKKQILNFFDAQMSVMLATIDANGAPVVRALINIRNPKIAPHLENYFKKHDRMLMITNTHSEKISEIRKNNTASFYTFDNEFNSMMLTGTVHEITDIETIHAIWDDSFTMYYPDGRDGGDFSVLEFIPKTFKTYKNFVVKKGDVTE